MFSALAGRTDMSVDDPATRIHPAVAPGPDDVVVVKKRVSAFVGSDLEVVLRSLDATSLVLTGISTSGVVLSTLRQAADLDFGLTVLSDACADPDPEVHRVLLEKVFPRQADGGVHGRLDRRRPLNGSRQRWVGGDPEVVRSRPAEAGSDRSRPGRR